MVMLNFEDIKKLRLHRGLSITQLAAHIGVTEAAVRRWEHDERHPRWDAAKKLSDMWEESFGTAKVSA
jgi:DNA-binding transcriptional regulator YiaG